MPSRHAPYRGITKIGPGTYRVRARAVDPRIGKVRSRQKEVECRTIDEAARARDALAEEIRAGSGTRPVERQRLADYAESWLRRRARRTRPATQSVEATRVGHLVAALGDYYVDAIRPLDVEQWVDDMVRRGYAPANINGTLRVTRQIARDSARDIGCQLWTDGVRGLREGRTRGPRGTALTAEQLRLFVAACEELGELGGQRERAVSSRGISPVGSRMLITLAWTGMRRGELLALRWEDRQGDELLISRSVWNHHEGSTKTNDPRRVMVVEPLARVLDEQRQWLLKEQHPGLESGLVFPASPRHRRGEDWYCGGSRLTRPLRRVVAHAELPPISLHSLRRTWEDLLRRAGVETMVRRSLGGWRTDEAQAIYATVDASERAAAGAAVVRLVSSSGDSSGDRGPK